jgi:hypothetical protein
MRPEQSPHSQEGRTMAEPRMQAIEISQLFIDPEREAREKLDCNQVWRLINSDPATWPPILCTPTGDGRFAVCDGWHRLEAARALKLTILACQVVDGIGYEESLAANLDKQHESLPLGTAERKIMAIWAHEQRPDLSMRAIARFVGVAPGTVISALKEPVEPAGKKPALPRFLSALLQADGEGKGFLSNRRGYVEKCILASRNPAAVIEALDAWLPPLLEGADRARAKLAEGE